MRPGRPEDLVEFIEFARRSAEAGELDAVPTGAWLENLVASLDWEMRSRVIERGGRPAAVVLVFERPVSGGTMARVEALGDPGPRAELLEWGLRYSRACGAIAAQVWRGGGRGLELPGLGLKVVRPFLRMDRPTLDALPDAVLPAGYRLVTETSGVPDHIWAETYNVAFAQHWRHSPKGDDLVAGRRGRPDSGPELMALTEGGAPAALVTCAVESYPDQRAQPVGIVATVGTVPEHRGRGLAFALLAEALRRLQGAGARSASLYVDGLNPNRAFDVYARAGFEVGFEYEVWEADFT
jgi:ribosomal protein S18 acetylase RimI-like enzyme